MEIVVPEETSELKIPKSRNAREDLLYLQDQYLCVKYLLHELDSSDLLPQFMENRIDVMIIVFFVTFKETWLSCQVLIFSSFNGQCFHHVETSQLICSANQVTGFYMMGTLSVKGLILETNVE